MSDTAETRPTPAPDIDLSVVICTRNRADSLAIVLTCLSSDEADGVRFEVVVVDNNSTDETRATVESFRNRLRIRYINEDRIGKYYALNRTLDEGGLGEIVAFIDDDLTLEPGWLKGVKAACDRWPEHDIFSGRSYVIFPEDMSLPNWAHNKKFHGCAFSVNDHGDRESELLRGSFPSGNHFWIRSRALSKGRRFAELLILPEPGLLLGLQQHGCRGIWIGDVVVGHRVQQNLLDQTVILKRMVQFGRDFPYVRLPNSRVFWQARFFQKHPYLWAGLCAVNTVRWMVKYAVVLLSAESDDRFYARIRALIRFHDNWETVRSLGTLRRYAAESKNCGLAP
jgi:glycosyltransferase involved in cell wall biosynthesis